MRLGRQPWRPNFLTPSQIRFWTAQAHCLGQSLFERGHLERPRFSRLEARAREKKRAWMIVMRRPKAVIALFPAAHGPGRVLATEEHVISGLEGCNHIGRLRSVMDGLVVRNLKRGTSEALICAVRALALKIQAG